MNFATLDRSELESILLNPPVLGRGPLCCSDQLATELLRPPALAGDERVRHVLAAAHELPVRIATQAAIDRHLVDNPTLMKDYVRILLAGADRETFVVVFLDAQFRVMAAEELFAGTLTQTAVYPREVVRRALMHNAAAIVCAHPHPSGVGEPSRADEHLTRSIRDALELVEVKLVDHIIVAGTTCTSMAERGLL